MRNYRKISLFIAVFAVFTAAQAQRSTSFVELGGYLMSQNYLGDVNNRSLSAATQEARLGLGVQLKHNVNSIASYGFDVSFGSVYSHDNLHGNATRDYQVDTDLLSVAAFSDIHFRRFGKFYQRNHHTPFVHVGLGALAYTPHLNTNAQYPAEVKLLNGAGSTLTYRVGMGWRFRRNIKTFYNLALVYNGTLARDLEGFVLIEPDTGKPDPQSRMDGFIALKLGMSLGFFEQ